MSTDLDLTPTADLIEFDSIAARAWGNPSECKAGALLVHGLGAHSGWFELLGRRLRDRKIFAISYDQVGFGRRRDQVFRSYEQWLSELGIAARYLKERIGDKPVCFMGNSMGAVVCLRAIESLKTAPKPELISPVKPEGLVMFSPGFDGHPETFTLPYRLRAVAQALISPESDITLPYTMDDATREQSVRDWTKNDPLQRFVLPARMALQLLRLTLQTNNRSIEVDCPVLMMVGGVDKIVDPNIYNRVFDKIIAPSKEKRSFDDAWHDLMFDRVIDQIALELDAFVSKLSRPAATV